LRQETLSERFGVSRTPIREALRRLAATGLVSFEPNRGVRVRTISREELREAFLVRAELEALVTELAVPRFDRARLLALRAAEADFARLTDELLERGRDPDERNALTGEWLLVSPHRTQRPWQGRREETAGEDHDSIWSSGAGPTRRRCGSRT